jgi:hypothetical protein
MHREGREGTLRRNIGPPLRQEMPGAELHHGARGAMNLLRKWLEFEFSQASNYFCPLFFNYLRQ